MKTLFILIPLVLICSAALAVPRATVVIRAAATVTGDSFELGDIATVTCTDTVFRLQLLNAVMGRCPLPGLTRPFNEGDVTLKLRQAGIDPETVRFDGADQLMLTGAGGAGPLPPHSSSADTPGTPAAPTSQLSSTPGVRTTLIHPGDAVTLVYDEDGMVISANVIAMSSGAAGDTINLRRDGAIHPLVGIVQDAQTVKMVE